MAFINFLTLSLLLSTSLCAKLRFYGASQRGGINNWKASKLIRSSAFTVCPGELPSPFTLVCIPSKPSSSAQFFIDGIPQRKERVRPYTIFGDINGIAKPWNPTSTVAVECRLSSGETVSATINFSCAAAGMPQPTKPYVMVTSPSQPPASPPTPTPRPLPGFNFRSGNARLGPKGKARKDVPTELCVKIPALAYKSADIGKGKWERKGAALFYKPTDSSRGTIPGGRVTATYKFKAPTTSIYGFTVDMETNGGVDHNDIWVNIDVGFRLSRKGKTRTASGWTKAYHNRNRRDKQVYTVDFNPHTFATRVPLQKGKEYTVRIGGRSTKTGFYSIILFPCSGLECDGTRSGNPYWQSSREKCGNLKTH